MASYRVLDIETIPDPTAFTPNPPSYKLNALPGLGFTLMGPPVWPAGVIQDVPFPPPQGHRVVAISWVDLSGDDNKWYFVENFSSICSFGNGESESDEKSEEILLRKFAEVQENDAATLVTWNGRTFDLPVLNLRSFRKGIAWPWYYTDRDVRYRYTESGHLDLMDVLSDYGACRQMKLGDAARLIGLPGKAGSFSGADIAAQVESCQGKPKTYVAEVTSQIENYCLSDSVQTAVLFLRHRFHRGMIDVAHYNAAVNTFADKFPAVFFDGFDWSDLMIGPKEKA